MNVSDRNMTEAHKIVSKRNPKHPIREYLSGLEWKGRNLMDLFWIKACHTPDNAYFRQAARMWLLGAVARVFEPGCKFDFAPIIEGPQGLLKSTLLYTIAGRWYGETEGHFENQQKYVESTQGFWILEIPELVQFSRSEVQAIKSCLTRRTDTVRMAYAKYRVEIKRQHVLAGTTNERNYFKDKTGNRRFWPIPCGPGQIDIAWVKKHIEQIWAEAMHTYREMRAAQPEGDLPLFLSDPAAEAYAKTLQGERMVSDSSEEWAGVIEEWLNTPVSAAQAVCGAEPGDNGDALEDSEPTTLRAVTCGAEIWDKVFGGKLTDFDIRQGHRVGRAMQAVEGWEQGERVYCGRKYGRQRVWVRKG